MPLTPSTVKIIRMKKIFTHINPDTDAIAGVWLVKKFLPGWQEAEIGFVEATSSIKENSTVDANPDVLYVDVGRGKLDHHQTGEYLSATRLCWEEILKQTDGQGLKPLELQAIEQLVEIETEIDNARFLSWPEVKEGRYFFYLHEIVDGLRGIAETDDQILEFGFRAFEAIFLDLKGKIKADEELGSGTIFETPWGKAIALETGNKQVLFRGEALGYVLVLKRDPENGCARIYSRADSKVDLTKAYNKFKEMDPESDWFLHATKRLLINQSTINPNMRPTKLTLKQIIEVLKK